MPDKPCRDCKHSFIFTQGFQPRIALWCRRPVTSQKPLHIQGSAYSRRPDQECGEDGAFWESNGFGWFRTWRWKLALRRINSVD